METDDHDRGLAHDLVRLDALVGRRRALGLIAGAGAVSLLPGSMAVRAQGTGRCIAYPTETAGPYPGYGGGWTRPRGETANILAARGIVRSDLRASLIGSTATASGVPLDVSLDLVDAAGCTPLAGHAVYLWQCDAAGLYSLYTAPGESYLRGVQISDGKGRVRFSSIVPGCYDVRYPHLHLQVFRNLDEAAQARRPLLTSQLLIPPGMARESYADARTYPGSATAFETYPVSRDGVFRDNSEAELKAMTLQASGDAARGFRGHAVTAIAL